MTTRREQIGSIAVLTMDNPPVNALSAKVTAPLVRHLHDLVAAASSSSSSSSPLAAVVIRAAENTANIFSGGADLASFSAKDRNDAPSSTKAKKRENGVSASQWPAWEVENFDGAPTLCLIHGACVGGALELALGCRYRVATADARLGLVEVDVGLLPGAGATQRLPRLIDGVAAAVFMVSGDVISAAEALRLGIVDAVFPATVATEAARLEAAAQFLATRPAGEWRSRKISAMPVRLRRENFAALEAAVESAVLQRRRRGELAPQCIVDCVKWAAEHGDDFHGGLRVEARLFYHLMRSGESRALRHYFAAERRYRKFVGSSGGDRRVAEIAEHLRRVWDEEVMSLLQEGVATAAIARVMEDIIGCGPAALARLRTAIPPTTGDDDDDDNDGDANVKAVLASKVTETDIMERLVLPLVNEALRCAEAEMTDGRDGAVVDVVVVSQLQMLPRWRGGPTCLVKEMGADTIVAGLRKHVRVSGRAGERWTPCAALRRLMSSADKAARL